MQRFEKTAKKKLAITPINAQRVTRDNWTHSGLILTNFEQSTNKQNVL